MIKINSMIKFHTLISLGTGPKHGYELIKELEKKLDRNISASHIYPFLKQLQKNKYVTVKETSEREKKVYALTSQGRAFAKKILVRLDDVISFALKSKLVTCAHCGCEVYKGDFTEKINGKQMHFCCCHCAHSYKKNSKS